MKNGGQRLVPFVFAATPHLADGVQESNADSCALPLRHDH